ncbi:MAG: histidine phosphatase family protein, partial [Chloroflexota bacterium]
MIHTYYIFRHGLATHSKTGYGDDILTAEVLPEAIPKVKRLGQYLKDFEADYHVRSELIRCRQTADIVA